MDANDAPKRPAPRSTPDSDGGGREGPPASNDAGRPAHKRRSLSAGHFAELVDELRPFVEGTWVREVEALPPRDLLLILEPRGSQPVSAPASDPVLAGGSETESDSGSGAGAQRETGPDHDGRVRRLRLSAAADYARLHLQFGRVRRHRGPKAPFFQSTEKALAETRLATLEALEGERIVRLRFDGMDGPRELVLEATGRHANWILCDAGGNVQAVLVPPRPDGPAAQRLARGAPYQPPTGGVAPASAPLVEHLPAAPLPELAADLAARAPLSWRVEADLGQAAEEHLADELRRDLRRRVRRRRKSARAKREGLETQEREALEAERLQRDGELLVQQHGTKGRGHAQLEVVDYYDESTPTRTLSLDPKRSVQENAERFFSRARKLKRAVDKLPAELAVARDHEAALEALLARVDDEGEDAFALEDEAVRAGWIAPRAQAAEPRKKTAPAPRLPYRAFHGKRGSEIRVGRSARDNDELTFRAARGNDLWLHTADTPGSHVVLRVERGKEPDHEEVLDAAHLAVHFSPLRDARRADVHIARCKEVKKPKRAPAGLVTLSGGKTLHVRIEPARLERLLRGDDPRRQGKDA